MLEGASSPGYDSASLARRATPLRRKDARRISHLLFLSASIVGGVLGGAGPVAAGEPPPGVKVLLVGDSVVAKIADTLAARLYSLWGWEVRSAAVPRCSVYGDALVWPDGSPKGDPPDWCPTTVAPLQDDAIATWDPDLVIWWDRLSTMPFVTSSGEFPDPDSDRFWELRATAFDEALARLTAGGARIVFVMAEPMGKGVLEFCEGRGPSCTDWKLWRMDHYRDITRQENRSLQRYALDHPDVAVAISITDTICRRNVSPCDDRMANGAFARPDGTHYAGRGKLRATRALVRDMRAALYG